jgi:hypothetical protein
VGSPEVVPEGTAEYLAYEAGCIHGISFFRGCVSCGRRGDAEVRIEKHEAAEAALQKAQPLISAALDAAPEALAIIQRNGFVFATDPAKPDDQRTQAERWEKLALSLYTSLVELTSLARAYREEGR